MTNRWVIDRQLKLIYPVGMAKRSIAVLGAILVALGAVGAHVLRHRLSPDELEIWKTGVWYGLVHVLASLAVENKKNARLPQCFWLSGVVVFSGSLVVLAVSGVKWLGAVTPVGGLLMIAGWLSLTVSRD